MASAPIVSGPITAFAYGLEGTQGTQVSPTNWFFADTGTFTDTPEVVQFAAMSGGRDATKQARNTIHKVAGKLGAWLQPYQHGPMWRASIGKDIIQPSSAIVTSTLTNPQVIGDTSLAVGATIPTTGQWIVLNPGGANEETVKVTTGGTSPITVNALVNAHVAAEPIYVAQGGLASAPSKGASTISASALPTVATGLTSLKGTWICVGSERKMIVSVTGAGPFTVALATPLAKAHAVTEAVWQPYQHVIVPYALTDANVGVLSTLTSYAQFGRLFEWQIPFTYVDKLNLKADTKDIKLDFDFKCQSQVYDVSGAANLGLFNSGATFPNPSVGSGTLTALNAQSAADLNDQPFTLFDGGLAANFKSTDAAPSVHNRCVSLDYGFDNKLIAKVPTGGGNQTELYAPGARMQTLKFKEEAFTSNTDADMYVEYVQNERYLPVWMQFVNPSTYFTFGMYLPRNKVLYYNPITALEDVVGFDGEFLPLYDATEAVALKISIINGYPTSAPAAY